MEDQAQALRQRQVVYGRARSPTHPTGPTAVTRDGVLLGHVIRLSADYVAAGPDLRPLATAATRDDAVWLLHIAATRTPTSNA